MKNKNKFTSIIYFVSAILFFIVAMIDKNYVYIPIGCCCVIFGSKYSNNKDDNTTDNSIE